MADLQKLTDDEVRHVAKLSRLRLNDDEIHAYAEQLSNVLAYVSKLNELDVEGVEPMAHGADVTNVMRDDVPQAGLQVDVALHNAPDQWPPFFKVPKVLGDGSSA